MFPDSPPFMICGDLGTKLKFANVSDEKSHFVSCCHRILLEK